MKRIFIIHGWGGSPEADWLPWMKKELESRGFNVVVPAMPNTEEPKIEEWVPFLKELVGEVDEETFFVGHSIGGQTILRYMEELPENIKIGGIVFVAPWFSLKDLEPEEKEIAKPWIETPINFDKVLKHTDKITAIFSDNDPYVPLETAKIFEEKFKAKIVIEHEKGHFTSEEDNVKELPSALNAILELSK